MDRYGMLIRLKENDEDRCRFPLESRSFGRNQKCDLNIVAPNVAGEHCKLEVNENNEAPVILRNLAGAAPTLLNGKPVSDAELVKAGDVITIFNHSFRFDSEESASIIAMPSTEDAAQEHFVPEELKRPRKARRNVPGKRKPRLSPLCEITLSSVENLDQNAKPQPQFSPNQQSQDDGLYEVPTSEGKSHKQLQDLVERRSRMQALGVVQETSESTRAALLDMQFQSEKVTQPDPLLHKSIGPENKVDLPVRGACGDGNDPGFLMLTDCGVAPCKSFPEDLSGSDGQGFFVNQDKEEFGGLANLLQSTAEMPNTKSGGKQKTRFSRRASSVGARGSPETNSLICHIARQRMQAQESKRILLLKSMMEEAYKAFPSEEEEKTSAPDISIGDSQETGTLPTTPCASDLPAKKKVTFGDKLIPELFDKRLPSNTPLRKGGTPVQRKSVFSDSPRSVLKRGSKVGPTTECATNNCVDVHSDYEPPFSPEINRGCAVYLEQLAKMADNLDNDVESPVDEGDICSLRLNFDCLSPRGDSSGSEELQDCLKNQEQLGDAEKIYEDLKQNQDSLDADSISGILMLPEPMKDIDALYTDKLIADAVDQVAGFCKVSKPRKRRAVRGSCKARVRSTKFSQRKENSKQRTGRRASNKKSKPGGQSITQESFLIPELSDGDEQKASLVAKHSSTQDVLEVTEVNDDKIILFEQLDTTVRLNSVSEFIEEKVPDQEHVSESTEQLRRSSRFRSNAKKDIDASQPIAKRPWAKRGRKVKVALYGKREYASKKPLLSPITEAFDEWPELGDLTGSSSPTEYTLNWSTPNIADDIPEENERDLSATGFPVDNTCAVQHSVTEPLGRKGRGSRTTIFCNGEHRVNLPSLLEPETLEEMVNIVKSPLSEDSENAPTWRRAEPHQGLTVEQIAEAERKITVRCVPKKSLLRKRGQGGNLAVVNCGSGGTPDEGQVLSVGIVGLVEIVTEQAVVPRLNCSLLLPESNVHDDLNNRQVQKLAGETQRPALFLPTEALIVLVSPASAATREEMSLSPPKARKVLQSRKGRRRSKLFTLAEISCEEQPGEATGRCPTGADGNNKVEKGTAGRVSACRVTDASIVAEIDGARAVGGFGSLLDAAERHVDMFLAAGQLRTEDGGPREASELRDRKKVRRSGRLSLSLNTVGLSWIDSATTGQKEKGSHPRSKVTLRKVQQQPPPPNQDAGEMQSGELTLAGGCLPRNGNGLEMAFDGAEEPPLKSILLD